MAPNIKKNKNIAPKNLAPSLSEDKEIPPAETHEDFQAERFKQTLQWLMEDRKISEAELSRLTKLSPATIHRLIYGITDPRLTTLRAITSFFKIRLEQLIGDYPIPSITQISGTNSEKILFSTPILIPFIEWEELQKHVDTIGDLTMGNWAHWHATTNETSGNTSFDFFATKLCYTAGSLLQAESTLIIKSIHDTALAKIGDCVIGNNEKGTTFIGQISGSGDEIMIKGGNSVQTSKCNLYGIVVKCEIPFSKIARYTVFI